jgi:hypothetical protein
MMADEITVTGEFTLKAWCVPKAAIIMVGDTECKMPVEKLSATALDSLAQNWLNHLYAGVGRKPPSIPPELDAALAPFEGKNDG